MAVINALRAIRFEDSSAYPNELVFWRSDLGVCFDGNGDQVTLDEIHKRREKKMSSLSETFQQSTGDEGN